jgi:hypothetical protein
MSGAIRDFGYKFSEGRLSRWLTLMLADRVNVVEDVLGDLSRGQIPNIPKEMGLKSELQYNAAGFAKKVALTVVITAVAVSYLRSRRRG